MAAAPPLIHTSERLLPPHNPTVPEDTSDERRPKRSFGEAGETDSEKTSDAQRPKLSVEEDYGTYSEDYGTYSEDYGTDSDESEDEVVLRFATGECFFPEQKPKASWDTPILEMFSVVIEGIDERHLSGYIGIIGNFPAFFFFKREQPPEEKDIGFINNDGGYELLMPGPTSKSFFAFDPISFELGLTDVRNNNFYQAQYSFHTICPTTLDVYNTPLTTTVLLKNCGSITFKYAVFNNAVAAKVEVMLLHHDNNQNTNHPRVFGRIYARDSQFQINTCLFNKTETAPCEIGYNDVTEQQQLIIPLSKSIVALSYLANLVMDLDLTDADTNLSIVKIKDEVFPCPSEESKEERYMLIPGRVMEFADKLRVTVTFAPLFF